jgi:two-component system sensor kinase FixL
MKEYPGGILNERYLVVLAAVAFLLLLNQVLVQPPIMEMTTDAPTINVAGRQRMLSQRLATAALALDRASDQAEKKRLVEELQAVLQLWSASHKGLRQVDRAMRLPGRTSKAVREAFDEIEPFYTKMREAATRLLAAEPATGKEQRARSQGLSTILATEGEYLARMDRIVGLFEQESRDRVDRLLWTGWVVTSLILAALAAIGMFVLRPAALLIRRQLDALRAARDELEDKVLERTKDLEAANEQLAREARERGLAEERHRRLLEQFSHVARTNTIGEMASGLAHEINQPLGAIANYAEGCLVELDSPRPALTDIRTALEKLVGTTMRAGEIIKRIRRFVTRQESGHETFPPERVLEDVEELLRDEGRRRGIVLVSELAPELPNLRGDLVQVQQVLVNLVRNAFEAVAAAEPVDPTVVTKISRSQSGDVEFRVTDNGEGIAPERLGAIFDAYFSTRAGGLGMGLAISRTIVEAHHGRIDVESAPGLGTMFCVTLPAAGVDDAGSHRIHR